MAAHIVGLVLLTTAALEVLVEGFCAETFAAAGLGLLFIFVYERPIERGVRHALSRVWRLLTRFFRALLGAVVALEGVGFVLAVSLPDPVGTDPKWAVLMAISGIVAIPTGVLLLLHGIRVRRGGRPTQLLVVAASAVNLIGASFVLSDLISAPYGGSVLSDARVTLAIFAIISAALAIEGLAGQHAVALSRRTVTA
jgi:hypothetical protein